MSRPLSASVCGKYDMPTRRPYERIAEGLISACRKHVVAATRPSPFKVGDNQRPERTMSGVRKPPPESSVPGETLNGGRRRNQFCRGYGSPSVLNEVSHEFSTAMRFEKCKRSPQQFIPAGFPLHNQLPTGTEDSASPLTTPDMVRSGRVLHTSVKSHFDLWIYSSFNPAFLFPESHPEPSRPCTRQCR